MIRRGNGRNGPQDWRQALNRQSEALAAQRARGLDVAGRLALQPIVMERTWRYVSDRGFTTDQLALIQPPPNSQRVQIIVSDPGYGKHGVRSSGWIVLDEFDPTNIAADFGISLDRVRSVVYDTGA